jgi:glutamate-ammonia-ligase adenylyltransferase
LTRTDIAGIKALKRKIEKQALREGNDRLNVKVGRGGIRDLEFAIQLLQLSLGAEFPEVRTGNTLDAIVLLEQAGGLTMQERSLLEHHYVFLRKIEHRLQIMFDRQTHRMPEDPLEQRKLALRLGFEDENDQLALERFHQHLESVTDLNRRILNHLLHNTVGDDDDVEHERDLILDPDPDAEQIERVLSRYHFADPQNAYRQLADLANERILFLSRRRCRHFLAAIAPKLLAEISTTPDADETLMTLSKVSDCLGGKGVLWELFSHSPPNLKLYVRLCAACSYLVEILTSNPGMLDELMDSLILERLPSMQTLESSLQELIRGAEDVEPILISFKHAQHLRVGARDIVGKEGIRETTATLADIAEVSLRQLAIHQYDNLLPKYGIPRRSSDGGPCELVILAAGKVGGREPNYHSDVDVIFLFEESGQTDPTGYPSASSTTNQHFFGELGQRIIKMATRVGPYGMLYPVDARLRPTGRSGPMATSFAELARYFSSGSGQLWERLAMCKARPLLGSPTARKAAQQLLRRIICEPAWQPDNAAAVHAMRLQMQETAAPHNLKRGPGGTVDVEFCIQMLQLKWGSTYPRILTTNVWHALELLLEVGLLTVEQAETLTQSYELLRSVEARLRLMNTTARHELPTNLADAKKLAYLLGVDRDQLRTNCEASMRRNREIFLEIVAACR